MRGDMTLGVQVPAVGSVETDADTHAKITADYSTLDYSPVCPAAG